MRRIVLYYGRVDDGESAREFWRSRRDAYAFWRHAGAGDWVATYNDKILHGECRLAERIWCCPPLRGILFVFDRRRRWVVGDGDDLLGYKFRLVDARELRFVVEAPPPGPEGP